MLPRMGMWLRISIILTACAMLVQVAHAQSYSASTFYSLPVYYDGPSTAVIQGSDGNFYGIFAGEDEGEYGFAFRVTPQGEGMVLYKFCSLKDCADGEFPDSIIQGTDGNFYGTTGGGYGS